MSRRPVRLSIRLINSLPVRDNMVSHRFIGKTWINKQATMIACVLPAGPGMCRTEVRDLQLVHFTGSPYKAVGEPAWIPATWRAAMWRYAKEWPSSGYWAAPFVSPTEAQHAAFLSDLGGLLAKSDPWCAEGHARRIGLYANVNKWRGR